MPPRTMRSSCSTTGVLSFSWRLVLAPPRVLDYVAAKEGLSLAASPVGPAANAAILAMVAEGVISGKIAKTVFEAMLEDPAGADEIIEKQGLRQVTDSAEIERLVDEVIAANPEQVAQYRAGKEKVFAFFIGQAMKASRGKANPDQLNTLLRQKLKAD